VRAPRATGSGRRTQIVSAAIEVIAADGFTNTTFSRIAKHAGLSSTSLISYHFAGKEDLLAACLTEIEQTTDGFVRSRVEAARGHVAQLRAYVESNVALVGEHPAAVCALIDLVKNAGSQSRAVNDRLALFEQHFRAGQAAGVFRPFDARTAAVALVSGLDAVVTTAARTSPEPADLARLGRELAELYVRATTPDTAREAARPGPAS
jgi:AcrR family transcriptional regulator